MEMDSSGSATAVQNTLDRLGAQRDELGGLWATRKLRLDLCLQLRLFERDALEVTTPCLSCFFFFLVDTAILILFLQLSSQYELWAEQLQGAEIPRGDIKETEVQLRNLSEHLNHIQTATYEVAQRGQDLLQHFDNSGINLMADSQYNGQARVQVLLEYIQEREIDIEDMGTIRRIKLEQCIQLSQFEGDANQVQKIFMNVHIFRIAMFNSIVFCYFHEKKE